MITKQQILVMTALASVVATAQAATIEPYNLYQTHCSKCHGESGAADSWRGYLFFARSFRNKEWQSKHSNDELLEKINKGPGLMPSYEKTLTEEEKKALIRVIRGFGS
ncbi:MAG: cytochrome c [Moraxellaceae bacterium]|nr:cytochrome c [Pseudomonadales bacterium]MCP5174484.1 cytochrome c [Moraxellaceae bacterium]HQV22654.1 cytochrome c [Agitococcus sp.]MCB1673237.1 cytochrome c [Pseudomonadales bacterium]MCP5177236.1 cytochrome c [Moraxellaceae bacterium]